MFKKLCLLFNIQNIHGDRNYEEHAHSAIDINEVSAFSRTQDLIPDGMWFTADSAREKVQRFRPN